MNTEAIQHLLVANGSDRLFTELAREIIDKWRTVEPGAHSQLRSTPFAVSGRCLTRHRQAPSQIFATSTRVAARIGRMNDAVVRRAQPADKPRLFDLWLRLSADGQAADPRYVLAPHAASVATTFIEGWVTDMQPTWVIETSGEVVAFIVTKPAAAHSVLDVPAALVITDAYVLDEHRRHGLGRLLYETARDFAMSEGFVAMEVGTLANDHRAVSFWRSVGFSDWRVSLAQELPGAPVDTLLTS